MSTTDDIEQIFTGSVPQDVTKSALSKALRKAMAEALGIISTEGDGYVAGSQLSNAVGGYLDLHARDRGLRRATDETDTQLRDRLRVPPTAVTVESIRDAVNSILGTTDEVFITELPRESLYYDQADVALQPSIYPPTAAEMNAAVGYGTWTASWSCDELLNADLAPTFGSVTMARILSPIYGLPAPRGTDTALGFDSTTDAFSGGDVYDVTGTSDLVITALVYVPAIPGTAAMLVSKCASGGAGYQMYVSTGGDLVFDGWGVGPVQQFQTIIAMPIARWTLIMGVVDRSTGKARLAVHPLLGAASVTAEVNALTADMSSASAFRFGDRADATGLAPIGCRIAYVAIAVGTGAATGMSANLSSAITNFVNYIEPIGGYPFDPATMSSVVGGTWTTGVGWLFNETVGNATTIFGSLDLTGVSSPVKGNAGPRGGEDKCVTLDSAADALQGGSASFDVIATDDLMISGVFRFGSASVYADLVDKGYAGGGGAPGWLLALESGSISFYVSDSVDAVQATVSGIQANVWYAIVAVLSRGTNQSRVAICPLNGTPTAGAAVSTAAVGSLSNGQNLLIGNTGIYTVTTTIDIAALYINDGNGVAGSVLTNIADAAKNLANTVAAVESVNNNREPMCYDRSRRYGGYRGVVVVLIPAGTGAVGSVTDVVRSKIAAGKSFIIQEYTV